MISDGKQVHAGTVSDSAGIIAPVATAVPTEPAPGPPAGDDTLASLLAEYRVPWEALHERYRPLLELTRIVKGVSTEPQSKPSIAI